MKIQLKRSNVIDGGAAKEPTAAQMEYGELAVNYSESDPAVFIKDSNNNIIRIAGKGANGGTELPDSGGGTHQPGTTDDRYVETSGDKMSGNLTLGLGTDKITLNASSGSAIFSDVLYSKSDIRVQATGDQIGTTTTKVGVTLYQDGAIYAARSSGNLPVFTGLLNDGNTYTSQILADGSAEFEGDVIVGDSANNGANDGIYLYNQGQILASRSVGSNSIFTGYTTGDSTVTVDISANGSAKFAGSISSDTGGFYRTGESGIVFSGNAIIPTDGNGAPNTAANDFGATFYQFKDGYFYGEVTTGSITARETSTFAEGDIILNSDGSGSFGDGNIVLRADGTSTFLGDITAPNVLLQGSLSQAQLKCDGGDFVVQTLNDGGSLQERLRIEDGGGTATFTGTVESTKDSGYAFLCNGGGLFNNPNGSGSLFLKGAGATYPVGAWNDEGNYKLEIGDGVSSLWQKITLDGSDGSASFAATVDVGSVLTASGGVRNNPDGTVFINPASSLPDTALAFTLYKDKSVDNKGAVEFRKDGTASFAGDVSAGAKAIGITSDSVGVTLYGGGGVYCARSADADPVFYGLKTDGNINTSRINADGSAEFGGGGFKIDGNGYIQSNIQSAGLIQLDSTASFSSPKIELDSRDGSATFESSVQVLNIGAGIEPTTRLHVYTTASGATTRIAKFQSDYLSVGRDIIDFYADGSAEFKGDVIATNITAFKLRMASAVASAADLSALKQAILDAVADL